MSSAVSPARFAVFDTKPYDKQYLSSLHKNNSAFEFSFFEVRLSEETVPLITCSHNFVGVVCFVHDDLNEKVVRQLHQTGIKIIAMRCAGFNNVHLPTCKELGITVVRVPAYSPYSVAEHAIGLMLALNRKLHKAYHRVREGDFSINGLLGFDLHGKTLGVIGTGKIGMLVCKIAKMGFGMEVICYDIYQNPEVLSMGIKYVTLDEIYARSDVISLHLPLTADTKYLINEAAINKLKPGCMIINTSRGALLDTVAVIHGLKQKKIGALGIDVYEFEDDIFYENKSSEILSDDVLARLLTFPNVLVTSHQAYFTHEAMTNIAERTLKSIQQYLDKTTIDKEVIVQ